MEPHTLPWFDEMCTGKKQMDIVLAAEKEEVSVVSAGALVTVGRIQAAIPAGQSALPVSYSAVNLAATLTKCCNEAITKLRNR